MIIYKEITNYTELYAFHMNIKSPYISEVEYGDYLKSLFNDTDSYGHKLFKELHLIGAYSNEELIGFIQFGVTNIGFDDSGGISEKVNYSVIRNLYFEKREIGETLLKTALILLKNEVYAFFHYFGMSCFSRHGKLSSNLQEIEDLLLMNGFVSNEINVYYSTELLEEEDTNIDIKFTDINEQRIQKLIFEKDGEFVGEAEMHLVNENKAYLRWIYVSDNFRHLGYGSKCMRELKSYLRSIGIKRLDTDTAEDNIIAQKYYERNGFTNLGKTKSYLKK